MADYDGQSQYAQPCAAGLRSLGVDAPRPVRTSIEEKPPSNTPTSTCTMSNWRFKLLYDGQCPICRFETRWLRRWNRSGHLVFEDISATGFEFSHLGVARDELMAVMHGILPDGQLVRGTEAFRQAYRAVGLGWLLAPTSWPFLRSVFDCLYATFARYRLPLGRLFSARCATGTCEVAVRAPQTVAAHPPLTEQPPLSRDRTNPHS